MVHFEKIYTIFLSSGEDDDSSGEEDGASGEKDGISGEKDGSSFGSSAATGFLLCNNRPKNDGRESRNNFVVMLAVKYLKLCVTSLKGLLQSLVAPTVLALELILRQI